MNVFVLCAGRTGSVTFNKACQHIRNFTAAHESRARYVGAARFAYPDQHIEIDNRLSWLLGRLDQAYGDNAFYVHLTRDVEKVAKSHVARYEDRTSIINTYHHSILMGAQPETPLLDVARDYCETVDANIAFFLRDRPHKMLFPMEQAATLFPLFWERIGAEGDLEAALREWTTQHNATGATPAAQPQFPLVKRPLRWVKRRLILLLDARSAS